MKFKVSCELEYQMNSPATFMFALKCLETGGQKVLSESLKIDPQMNIQDFSISGANRFSRFETHGSGNLAVSYEAEVSNSVRRVRSSDLRPATTATLDPEAVAFLWPSRYCQSDQMRQEANAMFGHIQSQYEIASAVSDWIYDNISYVSGSSGESSSAMETMEQRQGVCRDFAHLGITLCRALSVPARYASCYAHKLNPQDFHACFEVFIDGWWYVLDPTRLAPLNGLIRIATGRDATDTAVCSIFGDTMLTLYNVSCEALDPDFEAVTRDTLWSRGEALALL